MTIREQLVSLISEGKTLQEIRYHFTGSTQYSDEIYHLLKENGVTITPRQCGQSGKSFAMKNLYNAD